MKKRNIVLEKKKEKPKLLCPKCGEELDASGFIFHLGSFFKILSCMKCKKAGLIPVNEK